MSWAEFVLRSIGFRERQEREEMLFRAVAYQSYCNQFVWGKKRPEKIDRWWKIGNDKIPVTKKVPEAFIKAREEYLKNKGE